MLTHYTAISTAYIKLFIQSFIASIPSAQLTYNFLEKPAATQIPTIAHVSTWTFT